MYNFHNITQHVAHIAINHKTTNKSLEIIVNFDFDLPNGLIPADYLTQLLHIVMEIHV